MSARPRYNVQIAPVRDITLRGTADLAFWTQRLADENLVPAADHEGKAQLLLTGVDAKFMGLRFRELSIALFVAEPDGDGDPIGVFLIHAFNSRRSFAFVERTFYHTPYHHGRIRVETRLPAAFEVNLSDGLLIGAAMSAESSAQTRKPLRSGEEGWEGAVLLPRAASQSENKVFFGRLNGQTEAYEFTVRDTLTLKPNARVPVVAWLAESEFSPQEWAIRETATHARTKSVSRGSVELSPAGQPG